MNTLALVGALIGVGIIWFLADTLPGIPEILDYFEKKRAKK